MPPTCSSTAGAGRCLGTLLRWRRQVLHARAAAALEIHFADLVDRQPELLARHLTLAGDTERTVQQWLKRTACRCAISLPRSDCPLQRGLGVLHSLPQGPDRDGRDTDLQLALAGCLLTAEGAVAADLPYMRAFDLAKRSGSPQQRFDALWGSLWRA